MKQDGLFDAADRASAEKKRLEHKEKYGWNKERAQGYKPGHPWCDPDAYPSLDEIMAEEPANLDALYGWPTASTPKAAVKRAQLYQDVMAHRATAALRYEDALARRTAEVSDYDLQASYNGDKEEAFRNVLASLYNQLLYYRQQVYVAIRRWPELGNKA